ncbi:transcriptional regulator, LysR family [Acetobacteraceae bacterium AT-5844]|nr:transcriptional regulator, LysR family [Acetobacteraceae bacterium AT-5844]
MRTGSVTGASRLLGISQPAVSKILAQAQEACGFTLFERLHGRIVPTQRAFALFDETERLFVGMEEIDHLLKRLRAEEPRRALIASTPVLARAAGIRVPDFLKNFDGRRRREIISSSSAKPCTPCGTMRFTPSGNAHRSSLRKTRLPYWHQSGLA